MIISIHLNVFNICSRSAIIFHLKRAGPFIWTDLRSLLQKMLRQSLESLEIDLVFLNMRFIRWRQCIFAITLLFPLWKEQGSSFHQILTVFTPWRFMSSFVDIGLTVLEKDVWNSSMEFWFLLTWKRSWLSLCFPLIRDALCPVWLKLVKRY